MGFVDKVKGGANLTHPHLSIGWTVGAIAAIILLITVYVISKWGVDKVSAPVRAAMGSLPSSGTGSTATQNTDSAGWIY
jgi:hypothetical protein